MRSIKILGPNQLMITEAPMPAPGDGEVRIRVMASGICGTDIHITRGDYFGNYPVTPGHEFAGIIDQVGKSVARHNIGDRVTVEPNISCDNCYNCLNNRQNFCLNWQAIGVTLPGGMAQYVIAPEKAVFNIGTIPFEWGAFVEPLSCVLHGIERANIGIADRVAIIGAGPIGILLLQAVKLRTGATITMVEKNTARLTFASDQGAHQVYNCIDHLEQDRYDVVIDATGVISVIKKTIDIARPGGTILLFGVAPAGRTVDLEPFTIFKKGLTILSSFTSLRNSYQAIELLTSGKINVTNLVSHQFPLEGFKKGIDIIEQGLDNVKKVLILPNG